MGYRKTFQGKVNGWATGKTYKGEYTIEIEYEGGESVMIEIDKETAKELQKTMKKILN